MMTSTSSSSSSSASSSSGTGSGLVNGHCVLIDLAAATALLGGKPKQLDAAGAPPPPAGGETITKIDGCSYTLTDPTLGYAVNRFSSPLPVSTFINAAKAQMTAQPGVVPFDVKLGDAAVGFTVPIGTKTMARIEVGQGDTTVAVLVAGTDGAKATAIALSAAKTLLAAL